MKLSMSAIDILSHIIRDDSFEELKSLLPSSLEKQSSIQRSNFHLSTVQMSKLSRCYFFAINIITFYTYGLSLSAFGVSLQEYRRNIQIYDPEEKKYRNINNYELSYGSSVSSVVGCFSCLLAFYSLDKFDRQLQFGVLLIFYGLVTVIYPLAKSYTVYLWNSCLAGFVISYIHAIPSIWTVELFPENPTKYVQILHAFHPIGELTAPVLIYTFLNKSISLIEYKSFDADFTNDTNSLNSLYDTLFGVTKTSDLWIPYLVISGLKWLAAFLTLASIIIKKPYRKSQMAKSIINDKDVDTNDPLELGKKNLSKCYLFLFSSIVCIIVGIHWTNEQISYNYFPTYLQKKGIAGEKESTSSTFVCGLAIGIGRILNIFTTMFIKVEYMIYVLFIFIILGNIILLTIGHISIAVSLASIALIGLGYSSLYPFFIGFVEERISMSNKLIASMTLSAGVFQAVGTLINGKSLEDGGSPNNFIWLNLFITSFAFGSYIILIILERSRLRTIKKLYSQKINIEPVKVGP